MLFLQTKFAMFGRLTGNNARIMADMEDTIRKLGSTTTFTAGEIAEAAVTLAQANLSPKQVTQSLGPILDLARATRTDPNYAADALAKAIKTFELDTNEMGKIASYFVAATRLGPLNLDDLVSSLKYSQSTAKGLIQDLPTMLALFADLSNKGMMGSIAGTSTNTAMMQIAKKFEEMQKQIPNFNVMYDQQGLFNYVETIKSFKKAVEDLDVLPKQALTGDVFNLRGARSVGATNAEQVIAFYKEITNAVNEAELAAKTMDSGTTGAIMRLSSAFDELVLAGGKVVSHVLIPFFETTSKILNQLSTLVPQYKGFVATMLLIPPVTLAGGIGLIMLAKGLRTVAGILGVVRSGFNAVFGSFAQGTSGQISAAVALYKSLRGKMGNMSLSMPKLGIGNAVRGAAGAVSGGINRASTAIRATATISANKKSLESILKIYRYEKLILDIKKRRGIATAAEIARQAQLVKGIRNSITALRLSTRLAVGARSTALGTGALKNLTTGKVLASMGRGVLAVAKGMMTLTRVTFQFGKIGFGIFRKVFSVGGLWAIAELLLLFGDKIPFVKDVMADFGKAFSASFAAISRIAQYAQGPLALIGAGIGAISDGFTGQGVNAIIDGVSNLAGIIRNQLISAWNLFFAKLGETWNVIRGIGTAIWEMFTALYNGISTILTTVFGVLGAVAEGVSQGGAEQGIQKTLYGWVKYFVTEGAVLFSDLI
jgi:TP901 family phage tail tape measure protein